MRLGEVENGLRSLSLSYGIETKDGHTDNLVPETVHSERRHLTIGPYVSTVTHG